MSITLEQPGPVLVLPKQKDPIPAWMKQEVVERDGWQCKGCKIETRRHPDGVVRYNTAHFDHVHPESKGGLTVVENLQVLCRTCNLKKGAKVIDVRKEAKRWYDFSQMLKDADDQHARSMLRVGKPAAWTATRYGKVLTPADIERLQARGFGNNKRLLEQSYYDFRARRKLTYHDLATGLKAAA